MNQTNTGINQGEPFLPVKVIVVGSRKVGKTTLIKKLIDNNFQVEIGKENETHGLSVVPWTLTNELPGGQRETVRVRTWDFGEKELLYQAYRFFFTGCALYILVWEPDPNSPPDLERWLYSIKRPGKNSPVLVVMNKSDLNIQYIDKVSLEKEYPNIKYFHTVSCVNGKGIPALMERIRTILSGMRPGPDGLIRSREQILSRLQEEKSGYISTNGYFNICKEYGLDMQQARSLSQSLHDEGIIFHFQQDPFLENIVILDSQWITSAVYALMENPGTRENKGIFDFAALGRCLDIKRYPREIHAQLVSLMEHVELCFKIDGSRYIIPLLLPERTPVQRGTGNDINKLSHYYEYKYMPEEITGHLLARFFYLIEENSFWKNSLELKYENSRARVGIDLQKHAITVSVTGTWQIELLSIIKNHIGYVHKLLSLEEGKNYKEKVPCVCTECIKSTEPHLYDYETLKHFNEKKDAVFINCPESLEDIEINVLLRGISTGAIENRKLRQLIADTKGAVITYFKTPKDSIRHVITGADIKTHFTRLAIDKYRVLEALNITNLNRINLFAGINNSGKSSLLEAIYLLTNLNNVYSFFEIAKTRGKFPAGVDSQWIDNHFNDNLDIRGVFDHHEASVRVNWQREADENLDKTRYLSTIKIEAGYKEETFGSKAQLFRDEAPKPFIDRIKVLCGSVFSSPFSLQDREEQFRYYRKSIEMKTIDRVEEFLKKHVDKNIKWIRDDRNRFMVNNTAFSSSKDLTLFGEGMQRIFHITLQFASAQNGVLLIDEMENAIHYELLVHFARFIVELAREFNTQVFITSHSKECIDAFFQEETWHQYLTAYRLAEEDNRITCKFIKGPRMARLIKSINADLRGEK